MARNKLPYQAGQVLNDVQQKQGNALDLAFAMIVLLTSGFSGVATFIGYSYDLPIVGAVAIALIVGISLFALNFAIKSRITDGESFAVIFIPFFLIFCLSFISNTNAIYTFFVDRDIVGDTQEQAWEVFDAETNKLLESISSNEEIIDLASRKTELQVCLTNLEKQITDPRLPGLGPKARQHLYQCETLAGGQVTSLVPPPYGSPMPTFQMYANELVELIVAQASADQKTIRSAEPLARLANEISDFRKLYGDATRNKSYSKDTTDLMARDLQEIASKSSVLLGKDLAVRRINNSADETGSFQYTWRNFANWISPAAILLSIFIGAILDLFSPILSMSLFKKDEELF